MAEKNVVRQDVIEIGFETDLAGLAAADDAMAELKASVNDGADDLKQLADEMRDTGTGADALKDSVEGLGDAGGKKLTSGFEKLKSKISGAKDETKDATSKSHKFRDALREAASVGFEKLKSGITSVASALGTGIAKAAKVGLGAIVTGSGAALKGLKDCMDALSVQTAAETQLATTAKNMGIPDDAVKSIKAYASELQGATMYGDEAYTEAATYFTDADAIKTLMGTVADYAAGMSGGVELSSDQLVEYTTNLAKMTTGAYDAMTKKGFEVTDAQKAILESGTDMEKVAVINDIISESWGGMAKSFAETPTGKLTQLKNIFSDVKESIGAIFSPKFVSVLGVLTDALSELRDILADGWQDGDLERVLGVVNGLVDKGVKAVEQFAPKLITFVTTALTQVVSSIAAVLPGLSGALLNGLLSLFSGVLDVLEQSGGELLPALVQVLTGAITGLVQLAPRFWTVLGSLAVSLINSIAEQLPAALPVILSAAADALQAVVSALGQLTGPLLNLALVLITNLANGLLQHLPTVVTCASELLMGLVTGLLDNLDLLIETAVTLIESLLNGLLMQLPQLLNLALTLIQTLAMGLLSHLDVILNGALRIIGALLNGLLSCLPQLIVVAIQFVVALANGLLSNIGMILNTAITFIVSFVQMLIQNLPLLIQAAVTLVQALLVGLFQALPTLLQGVVSALGSVVEALFSVDWLSLGWELLKAVMTGIWEGIKALGSTVWSWIKSLFTGGEVEFPNVNIAPVSAEVTTTATAMSGTVDTAFASMTASAASADASIAGSFAGIDASLTGISMPEGFDFDTSGVQSMTAAVDTLGTGVTDTASTTVTQLEELNTSFTSTSEGLVKTADATVEKLRDTFHTDKLRDAGVYMMDGLTRGILSRKDAAVAAAASVAAAINAEYAKIQQIHSPSRVWERFGENQIQGGINGMENMLPALTSTVQTVSETAYPRIPDTGAAVADRGDSSGSVENNSYAPQFNLYLSGADSDRDMERKVKRWIREAMEDMLTSAQSRSPRVREV